MDEMTTFTINLESLYGKDKGQNAKLDSIADYVAMATAMPVECKDVILTGAAPIWLYLKIAHALHGKVKSLSYSSPVTGTVNIFDHDPF